MTQPNLSDYTRTSDTVTPIKWRTPDGKVYERTGERRVLKPGEAHWCNGNWDRPQSYGGSEQHTCAVWKLSDDQDWEPPEIPPADSENPIDRLIRESEYTDNLAKVGVLATLYQAKALERIADALEALDTGPALPQGYHPDDRFDVITAESRPVCSMCNHGEHASCEYGTWLQQGRFSQAIRTRCECPICWQAPVAGDSIPLHHFEGMEANHFCAAPGCGGGRLHPIHKA